MMTRHVPQLLPGSVAAHSPLPWSRHPRACWIPPQLSLAPALLDDLINDLAGLDAPPALALDDYHVIGQPAIHEALNYLVEHQPLKLHLLVLSRTDPPLPLPAATRVRADDRTPRPRSALHSRENP